MEYKEKFNMIDMMQGEFNRICVSQDSNEVTNMFIYLILNLGRFVQFRLKELKEGESLDE